MSNTPRKRMTLVLAGQDPHHPIDKPPAAWHALAMNRIFLEMGDLSDRTAMVSARKDWEEWSVYELWGAMIQHIREGGS